MKTQRILQLISKLTTKGLPGIFVGLVAMLAAVLYSGAALADVSQATIRGTITLDGQTAPADTAVTAVNADTGYKRSATLAADGSYVMESLSPGRYQIVVGLAGGEQRSDIIAVRVGQTARLDLDVATRRDDEAIEEVIVVGTQIARDYSSQVGTYITPEQMERLPQVTRNFLSFADQALSCEYTRTRRMAASPCARARNRPAR